MADDAQKPPTPPASTADATAADKPEAAGDKPPGTAPAEPLKAEVSRTDSPGAGVSAAPVGPARTEPAAPKPANVEGAVTATTSETSSATGQPTAPAAAKPPAPKPAAAAAGAGTAPKAAPAAAAKPAAPAAKAAPAAGAHAGAEHVPKAAAPTGPTDPAPPADAQTPVFIVALQAAIPDGVAGLSLYLGDWTVMVPPAKIVDVARHLHDASDARFDYLSDLTATDWPPRSDARFDVVYMLYSTRLRQRVRLKVKVGEGQPLASVTGVWPAANWLEREVYDMFGVNFTGHPDRRRILMPEDWQGFPQRKDYPLEGPGELLMENPLDWLKLRQAKEEAEIE
jgi:NADH-quinone oxidoreductase subunit C